MDLCASFLDISRFGSLTDFPFIQALNAKRTKRLLPVRSAPLLGVFAMSVTELPGLIAYVLTQCSTHSTSTASLDG